MPAMVEPKIQSKPGAGRPKGPRPRRKMIAAFKGSPEFASWLDSLVKHCRMPTSSVIENALIEYARIRGFNDPAPER